ncbi:hypothetical protein LCGC14_1098260 [marine sediment metagenome]|uniref:Uncharacterized protein n=1 Tax=marine sediment metagenome TaxID=412755 RepID=A0A0F9MY56_9ZZZZ
MNENTSNYTMDDAPGVITVETWTLTPNGARFIYFWCKKWLIVPDKQMPIADFRSSEKWTLFAIVDDRVVASFPGCQIKGWFRCESPPVHVHGECDCCSIE